MHLTGPEQQTWFDYLEADNDNFRTVLLSHTRDETGLRLAGAVARFWTIRGYFREGADWLQQVLEAPENSAASPARTKALNSAGTVAYHRTDLATARSYYEESLRVGRACGDTTRVGRIILNIGNVAYRLGDYAEAQARYEEALNLYRAAGDDWGIASALGSLGNVAQDRNDYAQARAYQEESLALSRRLGDTRMTAYTLHNLGILAALEGDGARARLLYEESLAGVRALGDRRAAASLLISLAYLTLQSADFEATRSQMREAIPLVRAVEDRLGMLAALDVVALYAREAGSGNERAIVLWAAAQAGRVAIAAPRSPADETEFRQFQEDARQYLGPDVSAAAWARGSALTIDDALRLALEEVSTDPPASLQSLRQPV